MVAACVLLATAGGQGNASSWPGPPAKLQHLQLARRPEFGITLLSPGTDAPLDEGTVVVSRSPGSVQDAAPATVDGGRLVNRKIEQASSGTLLVQTGQID